MINQSQIEAWFAADSRHWEELRKALDNPIVQRALSIVNEMGKPVSPLPPEGVPFLEWNALQSAALCGYSRALGNLVALAEPPPKQKKRMGENILQPWQHLIAETPAAPTKE